MDARRLRYFAAVVEQGGFAQAAASLHVTQPAISMAVRRLEEDVGATLLDRQTKPMTATVFGKAVYHSWKTHANEHQRLLRELRSIADLNTAQVKLVLGATFPLRPVINALESLRKRYPGFRLNVTMGSYTGDVASVIDGSVDMILSQLPANMGDQRIAHESLISDRFRAVCRRSHPLAGREQVQWSQLAAYPWAGAGPFDAFLPGWSEAFVRHGVAPPEPVLQTTSIVAMMAALLEHDYLAILPVGCFAEEIAKGLMQVLPVPGFEWPQEKGASWMASRSLSPGAAAYLDELRLELGNRKGQ
ncbi:LysR family transcriptional regulator [Stenotrophomonas koreensis]|uniref:LysR family transcriptional regulator n=1 Tax=Stenotrophomonas koreensis TaxID=266128 RepID=UPI00070BD853|nr:LysR family transcriptional regulator [Stenotrophomonas koreensis]